MVLGCGVDITTVSMISVCCGEATTNCLLQGSVHAAPPGASSQEALGAQAVKAAVHISGNGTEKSDGSRRAAQAPAEDPWRKTTSLVKSAPREQKDGCLKSCGWEIGGGPPLLDPPTESSPLSNHLLPVSSCVSFMQPHKYAGGGSATMPCRLGCSDAGVFFRLLLEQLLWKVLPAMPPTQLKTSAVVPWP